MSVYIQAQHHPESLLLIFPVIVARQVCGSGTHCPVILDFLTHPSGCCCPLDRKQEQSHRQKENATDDNANSCHIETDLI